MTLRGATFFSKPMLDPAVIGLIKSNLKRSFGFSFACPSSLSFCLPYFEIEKKFIPVLAAIAGRAFLGTYWGLSLPTYFFKLSEILFPNDILTTEF
jgi:hypothetical protein